MKGKILTVKGFSVVLLILTFFAFLVYQAQKSSELQVLRIISPTQIIVDLNKNGIEDDNEIITLKNIESFSTKPNASQNLLAKRLKISQENALGLGFLANNFAKETLDGKKVKIKNNTILIDNKNYKNMLLERGFAIEKGKRPSKELLANIAKVKELHLVIFNNKSHKYHKLTCKYGLIAHNSQILPISQIPQDAKPCKFCLKHEKYNKYKKTTAKYFFYDEIPYIKSPPTTFSTGSVKIFLTDMTKVLKPSNSCNTDVCKALVTQINSAQNSIDFAIYGYTKIPALQNALTMAQKRGVKIRFVYDLDNNSKNIYPDTNYLANIILDNNHDTLSAIMHDKFFIFDNQKVFTGSANISNTDMSGFNSNAIILINSPQIANFYSKEFEQMYQGEFHKQKKKIKSKTDTVIDGAVFSVYFSPKDKPITKQIIQLTDSAHKYIYIPAFLITHKALTDSLINAAHRGLAVKIILDATNTHVSSSKLKMLRQNGIQVKTENLAGKLHSKSIIIDDTYTIIGSMNFSKSAENSNDENVIIIKDQKIAVFYKTFFQYLWKRIPDKWLKYNARSESYDSIGSCNDGIDNDFDGKIDKADDSCKPKKIQPKTKKKKSFHAKSTARRV